FQTSNRLLHAQPVEVLLQDGGADALHFQQLVNRGERAVGLAVGDDGLGLARAEADPLAGQGGGGGGVEGPLAGNRRALGGGILLDGFGGQGGHGGGAGQESQAEGGKQLSHCKVLFLPLVQQAASAAPGPR